jgi:hypothetical protein
MQVLVCLADHAGELVSKEQLMRAVWADTFVTDEVLTRCISELRKVFSDDAKRPRFIETIPRSGYRLLQPVQPLESPSKIEVARRRRHGVLLGLGGALALLAVLLVFAIPGWRNHLLEFLGHNPQTSATPNGTPNVHSIAVLPLENLSGDVSQVYFAYGMTDELITNLAKIESLRVISRTSVMQYKQTRKPLPRDRACAERRFDCGRHGVAIGRSSAHQRAVDRRQKRHSSLGARF